MHLVDSVRRRTSGERSPIEIVLRRSANLSLWAAIGWITPFWTGLIILNEAIGPRLSLTPLYLLPLCLTTWCLGRLAGLGFGVVAVIATLHLSGFANEPTTQPHLLSMSTAAWNAGIKVFGAIFVILLVGAFRRAFDQEQMNAGIDPLTGLGNRRYFNHECSRIETSAPRDNRILLCGMIDLDNFKIVNDQHGHTAGDDVLKIVARALAAAVRPYDVTARVGGDEFAFCLAVRDATSAERKTARIHQSLIAALMASEWSATCSLGASTGTNVEETLKIADKAMFQAKLAGKSSCIFSKPQS